MQVSVPPNRCRGSRFRPQPGLHHSPRDRL
jgi:hypothetical protein